MSPALGILEPAGHRACLAAESLHRRQVRVHTLAFVEPPPLALVAGEHGPLAVEDVRRVDEEVRAHRLAQRPAVAVRLGVIDGHVAGDGVAGRVGLEVVHASHERRRHGQAGRVLMVFHVIVRRLGQENLGRHLAHDGGHAGQERLLVIDLDVRHKALVIDGPDGGGRGPRLVAADANNLVGRHVRRAARTVRDVHRVEFVPRPGQADERAGHQKLDVVGMGGDGEGASRHIRLRERHAPHKRGGYMAPPRPSADPTWYTASVAT